MPYPISGPGMTSQPTPKYEPRVCFSRPGATFPTEPLIAHAVSDFGRLQCARAYPTESQIAEALSGFRTSWDLMAAGFPAYEAEPNEPPADFRTWPLLSALGGRLWE